MIPRVLLSLALLASAAAPAEDLRPSFVFFLTDDHAQRAISAYGSDLVKTPQLDRIAAGGVRFANSFVTNSICAPARAVILTGRHSHSNGVLSNAERFDASQPTFPAMLRESGYQTALIGKWHLKSDPVGFDHWEVLPGQGSYYNPAFLTPDGEVRRAGYVTDLITEAALRWLDEERDPTRPFLLLVWHKAPHRAWLPGPDHLSTYDGAVFPEPATLFDDYAGRGTAARRQEMTIARHLRDGYDLKLWPDDPAAEAWGRKWTYGRMDEAQRERWHRTYDPLNAAFRAAAPTGDDLVRWKYQRYLHDYLGCIASVDDGVGQVLDALDAATLSDRTAVVYSSDQGFYLGEHGWYDKRWMYEESLRTPLLVKLPKMTSPGSVVEEMVQNVDLAPTFLELAGIPVPDAMQGRSLAPFLRGAPPTDWRHAIYYQYLEGAGGAHNVHRHYGVRTERFKLIRYDDLDEWELFDLERDPRELRSVFGDAASAERVTELRGELARLRRELDVPETGVALDDVVPAGVAVPAADLALPLESGVYSKAFVVGVAADGTYLVGGEPTSPDELAFGHLMDWVDAPLPWGGPVRDAAGVSTKHVVVAADARAPWHAVASLFMICVREGLFIDRLWCAARRPDGTVGALPFHLPRHRNGAAPPTSLPLHVRIVTTPQDGAFDDPTRLFHAFQAGEAGGIAPRVDVRAAPDAPVGTVVAVWNELRRFGCGVSPSGVPEGEMRGAASRAWVTIDGRAVPDAPSRPAPGTVVRGDPRDNPSWLP